MQKLLPQQKLQSQTLVPFFSAPGIYGAPDLNKQINDYITLQ